MTGFLQFQDSTFRYLCYSDIMDLNLNESLDFYSVIMSS